MKFRPRQARLNAFAKINLGLKVLYKRPDGYHELRTIYQTISLSDKIELEYTPARHRIIRVDCSPEIPDNLAGRAAELLMDLLDVRGELTIRIKKRIPLGAGLGGGSTDAAAVLLSLPAITGSYCNMEQLLNLAAQLGSDVPLFLIGGTVLGIGRGSEVYSLPDTDRAHGLLVIPPAIQISTPEAYQQLSISLTRASADNKISIFQSCAWRAEVGVSEPSWPALIGNDFEEAVFRQHPRLRAIRNKLQRLGAAAAMLTGSGAGVYGIFESRPSARRAAEEFPKEQIYPFVFVSRKSYRAHWLRRLWPYAVEEIWPPLSQVFR